MRKTALSRPRSSTVLTVLVVMVLDRVGQVLDLPHVHELKGAATLRGDVDHDGFAFVEVAVDQLERQRILDQPLDRAPHRPGAVLRVVTFGDDDVLGGGRNFELELAILQEFAYVRQLDVHDLTQVFARQSIKYDDIVNAVQKLGPEV